MAIIGPYIHIGGLIYVGGVIASALTDLISLVPPMRSNEDLPKCCSSYSDFYVVKIAHLLRTVANCTEALAKYYAHPPPEPHLLHPSPCFTSFIDKQGTAWTLKYTGCFDSFTSPRTTFFATAEQANTPFTRDVVVKFTDLYSDVVHTFMETRNLAPRLHFCQFQTHIGQFVVISDYLENADKVSLSADGYNKLSQALEDLHKGNMVYGDLR